MKLSVTTTKVEITQPSSVNQGEYNATVCEFEFSNLFDDLVTKAVFTDLETGDAYEVPILDNTCNIPVEMLRHKGDIKIGVYGYEVDGEELKLRYSPIPTRVKVNPGSYNPDVKNPGEVTPSHYEIY